MTLQLYPFKGEFLSSVQIRARMDLMQLEEVMTTYRLFPHSDLKDSLKPYIVQRMAEDNGVNLSDT